ncbi:MAG: hypothetical protein AB7V42_06165 [Thermoleophilia bacterium]
MTTRAWIAGALGGLVAVAAAVTVAVSTRGGAADGWTAPATLQTRGYPIVTVAPDGTTMAAWRQERGGESSVLYSERPPGGEWSTPAVIVGPRPWGLNVGSLTAGPDGGAMLVFAYGVRARWITMAAVRAPGGPWSAPQAISPVHGSGGEWTATLMGDAGRATIVRRVNRRSRTLTETAVAGGRWTAATEAVTIPGPADRTETAVEADGRALVVLSTAIDASSQGTPRSWIVARSSEGAWRRLPMMENGWSRARITGAAFDAAGRPAVVWLAAKGKASSIRISRLDHGRWTRPETLDDAPTRLGDPALARVGDDLVVVWSRWTRENRAAAVEAAVVTPDGSVVRDRLDEGAAVVEDPPLPPGAYRVGPGHRPPPIQTTADGETAGIASWTWPTGRYGGPPGRLRAAVLRDGRWSPRETLADGERDVWAAAGRAGDRADVLSWTTVTDPNGNGFAISASQREP